MSIGNKNGLTQPIISITVSMMLQCLRDMEYAGTEDDPGGGYVNACPICGGIDPDEQVDPEDAQVDHTDDCKLVIATRKGEVLLTLLTQPLAKA